MRVFDKITFYRRLRQARKDVGMTQTELGKKTGLGAAAISHFECGRRFPCIENFRLLCYHMGVSADHILDLEAEGGSSEPRKVTRTFKLPHGDSEEEFYERAFK